MRTTYKRNQDQSRNGFVTVNTHAGIFIGSLSHEARFHDDGRKVQLNAERLLMIFACTFFAPGSPVCANSLPINAIQQPVSIEVLSVC
jgi:hypothetical protein